jgi:hypothetical protein
MCIIRRMSKPLVKWFAVSEICGKEGNPLDRGSVRGFPMMEESDSARQGSFIEVF